MFDFFGKKQKKQNASFVNSLEDEYLSVLTNPVRWADRIFDKKDDVIHGHVLEVSTIPEEQRQKMKSYLAEKGVKIQEVNIVGSKPEIYFSVEDPVSITHLHRIVWHWTAVNCMEKIDFGVIEKKIDYNKGLLRKKEATQRYEIDQKAIEKFKESLNNPAMRDSVLNFFER